MKGMLQLIALLAVAVPLLFAAEVVAPLRTPDGQPDLQGTWTNATLTPLERPGNLANKEFLTEQEAAEFARQALQDVDADRRDGGSAVRR